MSTIRVEVAQGIATITFNRPKSLNAIQPADYDAFAEALREIDARDDVVLTVWQATGKWFCAGTDVHVAAPGDDTNSIRQMFLNRVARAHTDVSQALYTHRKILVAALNGPVMGIAAAFLGHFDFIYSLPNAWLSVPFTFLGIITEGGSSITFSRRMGSAKAKEVLIFGKKMSAQDLLQCGFVNKIFPSQTTESFHDAVRGHLLSELEGLDPTAVLTVKKLLASTEAEANDPDAVNLRESFAQAARMASGIPAERFAKIARKEIKHKL